MSILVVDVGTSGLRAAVVRPDGEVTALEFRSFPPSSPFPGLVEFDAAAMARTVLEVCLLYTSDAADERSSVDLGGRRIIKKKK